MIRRITASFGNVSTDLWDQVSTWEDQDCNEVAHCLRALNAWRLAYFEPKYGALEALEHRTDGDDPPGVVAIFSSERCSMEHSQIEPEHRKAAYGLQNRMWKHAQKTGSPMPMARVIPAAEIVPKRGLAQAMMPGGLQPWTFFEDEINALMKIVVERAREKVLSARSSSVIVLQGGLLTLLVDSEWQTVINAHKAAARAIQGVPEQEKHVFITLYEVLREGRFFTSIYCKERGFAWRFADPGTDARPIEGLI